jgi:hypothetical protein
VLYQLTTGFFGIPAEDQYNLEVMIEAPGFNCTLAPWNSVSGSPITHIHANYECNKEGTNTDWVSKIREWEGIYLKDARDRLQKQMDGYELSIRDVANMVRSASLD